MSIRRVIITVSALALLAGPTWAQAPRAGKPVRIGLLAGSDASSPSIYIGAFRQGLRERGWVDGENVAIEHRYAEGNYDRLPRLARELVSLGVDVIVTEGTPPTHAAMQATKTIPIVMATTGDPVGSGLVASLARPGGNLTGASFFFAEINTKRLEILRDALPSVTRVAVLWNPSNPVHQQAAPALRAAAASLRLKLSYLEVGTPGDVPNALSSMTKKAGDAVSVLEDPLINLHSRRIAEVAVMNRLPTMFGLASVVEAGGLMSYSVNRSDLWRRAALLVDKILRGAKPGELPLEQAEKFDLVLNLKTAKALGLTIPPSLLRPQWAEVRCRCSGGSSR